MKKKVNNQNEAENSEQSKNEKSKEFLRFEEGLKLIFSLSPEDVKRIREEPLPPDPDAPESEVNS